MIRTLAVALLLWGLPHRASPPPLAPADLAQRLGAIESCRQGFANLGKTPRPHAADVSRACAGVYREPACAEAMRNPPEDPTAFASTIARACRDAYCPRLPAPRPRLCGAADLPPPSALLTQWAELEQQIMAFELGLDPKVLAPFFRPIVVYPKDVPAQQPAPRAAIVVDVRTAGPGRVRIAAGKAGSVVVRSDVAIGDPAIAALARDAVAKAPPGVERELILRAEKSVLFEVMRTLMAAFQMEGVIRVAVSTSLPPSD